MKAITLWQPWASLVACGAKPDETRSWPTKYRGPIAIHAGQRDGADLMSSEQINALMKSLAGTRYEVAHDRAGGGLDYIYPYGAVVATATLTECWKVIEHTPTAIVLRQSNGIGIDKIPIDAPYLMFGDYSVGRYIWGLADIHMLPDPIPAKGKQGLWNWDKITEDEKS